MHTPIHIHALPAVGELLDVPAEPPQRVAYTWVKLSAPEVVKQRAASATRIWSGRHVPAQMCVYVCICMHRSSQTARCQCYQHL
jgi:hypothetical protein